MEVKLRVLEGTNAGQEILLPVKTFMIGRAEECHLRPQSDLISRHQCAIIAEDSQVFVRDIGSKNGTFVNNERIRGEHPVKNGDRLRVGPLEFEIVLSTSVGGAKRPPVRDLKEAVARVAQSGPSGSLPVDQWLGDTSPSAAPAGPAAPAAQSSSDTGHHASGDTGRVSPAVTIPGGIAAVAAPAAVSVSTAIAEPVVEVSSATVPISASSTDTIAIRPVAPVAPPPTPAPVAQAPAVQPAVAQPAVPPAAVAPAAPAKLAGSVYGAAPAAPVEQSAAPAEAAPVQKPRHAPSVYVPPPPEPKVEAEPPAKDVPPPHGKMQKPGTANSRDAAADTLKRLFGRR
jgi:predicted component of type VI protein secretion system